MIQNNWGDDVYPMLSWFNKDNVESARVMVVGCGALGNEVLKNLALFGVGHIVVVDFDVVEYSNLTRSILFTHGDAQCGLPKVEVVAKRIKQINPAIEVTTICGDISHDVGLGLIRRMDVVVGCLDSRLARYRLNRLCMRAGVPWVDGGIDGLEGTARVFRLGENCYACNLGTEALKDLSRRVSCASIIERNHRAARVATTPIVASIIGAIQAQEALKLIHLEQLQQGKFTSLCGKMLYYEGQYLTWKMVSFVGYDDECPEHEHWSEILESSLCRSMSIGAVLEQLRDMLNVERAEIVLRNHRFVDYVIRRKDDSRVRVMMPHYKVSDFVERHSQLRFVPFSELYQSECSVIGDRFAYQDLTLEQLGVAHRDVLHVDTEKGIYYVEIDNESSEKL